jgi:1-acyl-sn-glycerol-3-phosphate acyltransferase
MYALLRVCARIALHFYFGRIRTATAAELPEGHAYLFAANHPNSFLDALVIATHLPWRMHFLARGDAFRHPLANMVLRWLYMTPVYRMSEGRAELRRTADSFLSVHQRLREGRSVLVFAEGISVNEAGLRPLGKGSARIAHQAWTAGVEVPVVPIWLHYEKFHRPFCEVSICPGTVMRKDSLPLEPQASFLRQFNTALRKHLLEACDRSAGRRARMGRGLRPAWIYAAIPFAAAGWVLHAPWYYAVRAITSASAGGTIFFDSVLFSLLFLTYPLWLLALCGIGLWIGLHAWAWCLLVAAPLLLQALRVWCRR